MFGCKRNHSGSWILNMLKLLDSFFGSPYKSELQKASLELMKACTSISAVWRLIYFVIRLIFWRLKNLALHTAVRWCFTDMTVSYRTPIFLAVDVLLINSSQTEIDVRDGGGRRLAFKITSSVCPCSSYACLLSSKHRYLAHSLLSLIWPGQQWIIWRWGIIAYHRHTSGN